MADGGWEHIRGAFIIQHLIEGAGWKEAGERKERNTHVGIERRNREWMHSLRWEKWRDSKTARGMGVADRGAGTAGQRE